MVVPRLTSNQEIYGIYTVCISLNMFFSYADLGFLGAGQKYATEYFAQKNTDKEMQVLGFVLYFLSILMFSIIVLVLIIAFNPDFLIKSLNPLNTDISSKLLLILALFSPVVLLQRFNSIVYSIRLEDYIYQVFDIASNLLKIVAVHFFITKSNYDIVGYFFTTQVLTLIAALAGCWVATRRYDYKFRKFIAYFRFSSEMFIKTKSLAFSSLLLTIAWILYYELDSVILSKSFGLETVAVYAIALTFLSFTRNLYNILYSPFLSRFNHFVGNDDEIGLYSLYNFLIKLTFPLAVIPPLVLIFYMNNIVITWVGYGYQSSVFVSQMFMIVALLSAVTIPNSNMILAKGQNRSLRLNALILPSVFYLSLWLLYYAVGSMNLAIAKVITIFFSSVITMFFAYRIIGKQLLSSYFNVIKNILFPLFFLLIFFYLFPNSENIEPKSFKSYMQLAFHIVPAIIISYALYCYLDKDIRIYILGLFIKQNTSKVSL